MPRASWSFLPKDSTCGTCTYCHTLLLSACVIFRHPPNERRIADDDPVSLHQWRWNTCRTNRTDTPSRNTRQLPNTAFAREDRAIARKTTEERGPIVHSRNRSKFVKCCAVWTGVEHIVAGVYTHANSCAAQKTHRSTNGDTQEWEHVVSHPQDCVQRREDDVIVPFQELLEELLNSGLLVLLKRLWKSRCLPSLG